MRKFVNTLAASTLIGELFFGYYWFWFMAHWAEIACFICLGTQIFCLKMLDKYN